MARQIRLEPSFVEFIPKTLEPDFLYIAIEYNTTAHLCACGCGHRVVLPLRPTDWRMTYDGRDVTMRPSIGNWGFECRSHYFISSSLVEWAGDWTEEQILRGRRADALRRGGDGTSDHKDDAHIDSSQPAKQTKRGIWAKLCQILFGE